MFDNKPRRRTFPTLTSLSVGAIHFSLDEREAFFAAGPVGGQPLLYHAAYNPKDDVFGDPVRLLDDSGAAFEGTDPALSPDGLSLYYTHFNETETDIWVATREALGAPFKAGVELSQPGVNTSYSEGDPFVSCDGATLYFDSKRGGRDELYSISLVQPSMPSLLATPQKSSDLGLTLSDDELTLYFGSDRENSDQCDIFMARRDTKAGAFGPPRSIYKNINLDYPDAISKDGCTLWFSSALDTRSMVNIYSMSRSTQ